jgi:hypothetical protein
MNHLLIQMRTTMNDLTSWIFLPINSFVVAWSAITDAEIFIRIIVLIGTFAITVIVNWEKLIKQLNKWRKK